MITFLEIEPWEKEYISKNMPAEKINYFDQPIDKIDDDLSETEILSVFIYSNMSAQTLKRMPKLKLIATRSTGFDHIDIEACFDKGIAVTNVPTYGENTVAEHTFALLLALSRRLPESIEKTRIRNFSPVGLRGFDLKGKTIGIIGTGHIGAHVARIAHGFAMHILAFDHHPDEELADYFDVDYVQLEELISKSDIISLHTPLNEHTRHMIDLKRIEAMKDGVVILNTSRGGLIDTHALLGALRSGKIGAAGLDVLEEEVAIREETELLYKNYKKESLFTVLENHLLACQPNVIITPHNAFNSEEALRRILETTLENIRSFNQQKISNQVLHVK
jgi:D-lactate dehydrogenase